MEKAAIGQLSGKVAIVTGAAGGIGLAIARRFVAEGAQVVLADYNGAGGHAVAEELEHAGYDVLFIQTNVAQSNSVQAMVNQTIEAYSVIDILINNAGIGEPQAPIHEKKEEDWDRVLAVDLTGVFLCMKYVLPQMIKQRKGAIVNMASAAGMRGLPRNAAYAVAKGGVLNLTKSAALEYAKAGIRVNSIAPVWTDTAMVKEYLEANRPGTDQIMVNNIPMKRLGKPEEIAAAALFLASDEASFITGVTLPLDGGFTVN